MKNHSSFTFNFKSFALRLLIPTLACLFFIGQLTNYAFENYVVINSQISGVSKVNRILTQTHIKEIPILGSSRAEGSYIPELLGENYYNYGIPGTQDDVMNFFLTEELKKDKETPILINLDLDGINSAIGDVGNYLYNSENEEVKKLLADNYSALYAIPFLKYHGKFESYIKYYLNERLNLTKYTNRGGSFELNMLTKKKFDELVKIREETTTVFSNNNNLKEDLINLVLKTKRPIVFIVAPYHKSYFKKFRNLADANYFLDELSGLPNVRVINFSQLNYPDSLYMNTTHLNYVGAKVFSQQLKDSLKQDIKVDFLNM